MLYLMINPRLTKKDWNLIKGAIRRVFSRSELRKKILDAAIVKHSDVNRPKVKTWVRCNVCMLPDAKSYMVVDHIEPVIPVHGSWEHMSSDTLIDRMWCEEFNLQSICPMCHLKKTALEHKARKAYKKGLKK